MDYECQLFRGRRCDRLLFHFLLIFLVNLLFGLDNNLLFECLRLADTMNLILSERDRLLSLITLDGLESFFLGATLRL